MNAKKERKIEYESYIRQFWVGLMDGDGSLQVNHWRKQSLQYRLVIKLKNDPDKYNYILLQRIGKSIGGDVRIVSSSRFVIWVENHKSKISQIVKIFDKYPPYTKRLYDQYLFYLESVKINNVDWYLENRDKKYQTKQYTTAMTNPVTSLLTLPKVNKSKMKQRFAPKSSNKSTICPCQSGQSDVRQILTSDIMTPPKVNKSEMKQRFANKSSICQSGQSEGDLSTLQSSVGKKGDVTDLGAKRCYRFVTSVIDKTPLNTLLETPLEAKRWGKAEWSKSITPQSAKSAQSGDTPDAKKHTEEQSFKGWLSGFIEAEGCFTLRSDSSKVCSFSISQKGEPLLLQRINMFFGGQTKVRKVLLKKHIYIDQKKDQKDDFYILEIYKKTVLEKVLSHCTAHPLYGEKQKSFNLFKKTFI